MEAVLFGGIGMLMLVGFFRGLARMGFAVGLLWFVGSIAVSAVAPFVGIVVYLAISAYGFSKPTY